MAAHADAISLTSIRTHCYFGDTKLATATSFLYRYGDMDYLVTARHNLSGRHAETGATLSRHGGIPDRIELLTVFNTGSGKVGAFEGQILRAASGFVLFSDLAGPEGASVLGHPEGAAIDVACIGPFPPNEDRATQPVNHETYGLHPLSLYAGDDVFILGYPHALNGGADFVPLWKRASIASYPFGEPRQIIVDTATRQGMSGAPVFVRQSGIVRPLTATRDGFVPEKQSLIGTVQDFMGCYTGRLGERDQLDASLGIVWTRKAIEEVITAGVPILVEEA